MRLLDSKMSLARKGDKEAYKFVYDSIKPDFINKVKKIYGNDVDTLKIEKIYDEMMNEYLYKDTKTYIKDAIMRRAKTCLNEYPSFDELIVTDPERIKKHYIEKEYNEIINKINLKILKTSDVKKLVEYDVSNIINNYNFSNRKSSVSLEINHYIDIKLFAYKTEKDLIYYCIKKIGLPNSVKKYYLKKYNYKYEEVKCYMSLDTFNELVIKELVKGSKTSNYDNNLDNSIKSKVKEIVKAELDKRNNKETVNKDILVNYYSYLIDYMYISYKDEINVSEEELKRYIEKFYYKYVDAYINGTSKRHISSYLITRLNDLFKNKSKIKEESDAKEYNKEEIVLALKKLDIDEILIEYENSLSLLTLKRYVDSKLNSFIDDYYEKNIKASLYDYLKRKIKEECIKVSKNYTEYDLKELKTPIK